MNKFFSKLINKEDPLLFHITHYNNLEGIVDQDCLLSRNSVSNFLESSHLDVQCKRTNLINIPEGYGKSLHDYVPFSFAPLSPMLSAIHNGKVSDRRQSDMIYLVTRVSKLLESQERFIFSDGHPIIAGLTRFYTDLSDLTNIDWPLMEDKYWADTDTDKDRKRRRQAEFLMPNKCLLTSFLGICVIDDAKLEYVGDTLKRMQVHHLQTKIRPHWYYK